MTLEKNTAESQISEILEALINFKDIYWVFTLPNADTEGRVIAKKIKECVSKYPEKGKWFDSLGQLRYISLLKNASLMVGNSSSGLIEAPHFELPVVNIGGRQVGRVRGSNVIDVPKCQKDNIVDSIRTAISPHFRESFKGMKNPYGEGNASKKIMRKLKTLSLDDRFLKKRFCNLPN